MDLKNKLPGEGQTVEDISLTHIRIILAKKSQLKLPCFHFVLTMHQLRQVHCLHAETQQRFSFMNTLLHSVHISSCNSLFLNLSVQHGEAPLATKWKQLSQAQLFAEG